MPAGTPVNNSIPSSIVEIAYMWNKLFFTASTTSSSKWRFLTFWIGIITLWLPSKPLSLHIWKNPSIFSLTPPIGCISPFWFTDPVTAKDWLIGIPDKLESRAYNSVLEALSPSTPLYNCSKHILAVRARGKSWANFCPK